MKYEDIHPDLAAACKAMQIDESRIHGRYSDVQIMCRTAGEARAICRAGTWKSMAEVFKTNEGHPDAKEFPYGADIPLAALSSYIASKPH